ncbi:hypothetical protein PY257_10880, partial [Ramlibacter sp. H39-3-26]|uniref:hypothetical protein n=1 Tax=Curvibacter soli TaxID=3031331 RepID=UPI0023DA4672
VPAPFFCIRSRVIRQVWGILQVPLEYVFLPLQEAVLRPCRARTLQPPYACGPSCGKRRAEAPGTLRTRSFRPLTFPLFLYL